MPTSARTASGDRYRLRMTPVGRTWRSLVFAVLLLFFLPGIVAPGFDAGWRVVSVLGVLSSLWSLRYVLGTVVEVGEGGLRLLTRWPKVREIAWYRIEAVEVVPATWSLELQLTSGETLALPPVERLEQLYDTVEARRTDLDG